MKTMQTFATAFTAAALAFSGSPLFSQVLFAPRADYGNITGATVSTIADFNKDRLPDIAVGAGTSVYILLQNSNPRGTFINQGAVLSTGAGNNVIAIASGDLNGDGNQDLVVSTTNGVFYFLGNGNVSGIPTFGPAQTLTSCSANSCGTLVVGAFNTSNNQYLDIVVWEEEGVAAAVYIGNGTGGFTSGKPVTHCGTGLAAGDFDGDGILDLLCGQKVFLGTGNATFTNTATLGQLSYFNMAANFTTGASLDAAMVYAGVAVVFPGNGNGTFGLPLTTSLGDANETSGAGAGDFNSDGNLDLAIYNAGSPGTLDVFLGEGSGLFQTTPVSLQACAATSTEGASNAVTMADLNGDGVPDVVVSCNSGNTVSVFLSVPPSVFLEASQTNALVDQSISLTAVAGSPAQGYLYVEGYEVQFYAGGTALGAPSSLTGGQATLPFSPSSAGVYTLTAALIAPNGSTVATSGAITVVVSRTGCATNDTAKLEIVPGTAHYNRTTGVFSQKVSVTNTSSRRIAGPIEMALSNLGAGVRVVNPAGFTSGACGFPSGAPLVDMGVCAGGALGSGHSFSFTVDFVAPSASAITYTPVAVEGYASR